LQEANFSFLTVGLGRNQVFGGLEWLMNLKTRSRSLKGSRAHQNSWLKALIFLDLLENIDVHGDSVIWV
jgi:hypothetical protein